MLCLAVSGAIKQNHTPEYADTIYPIYAT